MLVLNWQGKLDESGNVIIEEFFAEGVAKGEKVTILAATFDTLQIDMRQFDKIFPINKRMVILATQERSKIGKSVCDIRVVHKEGDQGWAILHEKNGATGFDFDAHKGQVCVLSTNNQLTIYAYRSGEQPYWTKLHQDNANVRKKHHRITWNSDKAVLVSDRNHYMLLTKQGEVWKKTSDRVKEHYMLKNMAPTVHTYDKLDVFVVSVGKKFCVVALNSSGDWEEKYFGPGGKGGGYLIDDYTENRSFIVRSPYPGQHEALCVMKQGEWDCNERNPAEPRFPLCF